MQTAQKEQKIVNGVNVTELFETIDAIGGNKEIAKFNFRARNKWINGGQNETVVDDYDGACQTFKVRTRSSICLRPSLAALRRASCTTRRRKASKSMRLHRLIRGTSIFEGFSGWTGTSETATAI